MKDKLRNVLLVLLFGGFVVYLAYSGVSDLTNERDLHTINIDVAFNVLEMKHTINYIIPTGTDYYYIGLVEETGEAYLIHAPKNWLEKNFDKDFMAINPEGVTITALNKEVSSSKTARELYSRANQLDGLRFPLGKESCLELSYKITAILKLVLAVLIIFLWIFGVKIVKDKDVINKKYVIIYTIILFAALVLLLTVLR